MRVAMLLVCALAACSAGPPAEDESLPTPPELVMPAPAAKPETMRLAASLHAATRRELAAVVAPDITLDRIAEIKGADSRARLAVNALVHRADAAALAAARKAVHELEQLLERK